MPKLLSLPYACAALEIFGIRLLYSVSLNEAAPRMRLLLFSWRRAPTHRFSSFHANFNFTLMLAVKDARGFRSTTPTLRIHRTTEAW